MRRLALATVVALAAVAATLHSAPGSFYVITGISVTDLGTLGGADSAANDINDAGEVVGWSRTVRGHKTAFLHRGGAMHNINTGLLNESVASGINNYSEIVGYQIISAVRFPVFWSYWGQPFQRVLIAPSTSLACVSTARAISDSGSITGDVCFRASVWPNFLSSPIDLDGAHGWSNHAYDINNAGVIVGHYKDTPWEAFRWTTGAFTDVLPPASGSPGVFYGSGTAYGINNNGQVVGYYQRVQLAPTGDQWSNRAILWHGGPASSSDLGTLQYGSNSVAYEINDQGFVAGHADAAMAPPMPGVWSLVRQAGFIWHSHFGMRELPNLPTGGLVAQCGANALSNRIASNGLIQVAGYCTVNGRMRAVRWDVTTSLRRPLGF